MTHSFQAIRIVPGTPQRGFVGTRLTDMRCQTDMVREESNPAEVVYTP